MVMLFSFIVHLILSSFHQKQMKKRIPENQAYGRTKWSIKMVPENRLVFSNKKVKLLQEAWPHLS